MKLENIFTSVQLHRLRYKMFESTSDFKSSLVVSVKIDVKMKDPWITSLYIIRSVNGLQEQRTILWKICDHRLPLHPQYIHENVEIFSKNLVLLRSNNIHSHPSSLSVPRLNRLERKLTSTARKERKPGLCSVGIYVSDLLLGLVTLMLSPWWPEALRCV